MFGYVNETAFTTEAPDTEDTVMHGPYIYECIWRGNLLTGSLGVIWVDNN